MKADRGEAGIVSSFRGGARWADSGIRTGSMLKERGSILGRSCESGSAEMNVVASSNVEEASEERREWVSNSRDSRGVLSSV